MMATSDRRTLVRLFGDVWDADELVKDFRVLHRAGNHVLVRNRAGGFGSLTAEPGGLFHSFVGDGSDRKLEAPHELE